MTTTSGRPSSSEWRLTTQQFRLLWADSRGAGFPVDLCLFGDEADDNADVHRANELAVLADLRATTTPLMQSAMTTLTRPRYTIGIQGVDARKPLTDTSHHLRLVSAWGGSGDVVIVARQAPGSAIARGGDVIVTRHELRTWTRDLVAMLPASTCKGRLPVDDDVPFDEIPIDVEVLRQVSARASTSSAAGVFVHQTSATCGTIRVQVGSEVDGRRPASLTVQYRDIVGDGRYLLINDSPGTALGVDDAIMASTLNRTVNSVKKRYEARANAGWD